MDKRFISLLVFENLAGGKNDKFRQQCVEKIIKTIHSRKWQKTYKSSHFVHLLDVYGEEKFGDVKFILMCQLLEILYFYRCYRGPAKNLHRVGFHSKLESLFLHIYGKDINKKTSNVLRILRNRVAHTGTLEKVKGILQSRDINALNGFRKMHKGRSLRVVAFSFNLLIVDMLFRCIGLEDTELFWNLTPPQFLDYFKE